MLCLHLLTRLGAGSVPQHEVHHRPSWSWVRGAARRRLQADPAGSGRRGRPGCPWSDTETHCLVTGNDFPPAVTPPTLPCSRTMVRLHTRAARGGRGRGRLQGRRSSRRAHPGGKPRVGWRSGLASARPLFFPGTGRRVSRAPVRRAGRAPGAFARSRSGRASLLWKVPLLCGSDPRATAGKEHRAPSHPRGSAHPAPPAAVPCPQGLAGSPGTRPQDRGRDGSRGALHSQGCLAGKIKPGAPRGDGGAAQGWRDRPRHRRPLSAPPPPAGRSCRGDGSTPSPGTGLRGSHGHGALLSRLPWGTPSRPLPRRQRGRPRAATSARSSFAAPAAPARRHRSPPAVTARAPAPGPCAHTRRGRAPWGPPCAGTAATSAPPVQAKLHPFKLSPL